MSPLSVYVTGRTNPTTGLYQGHYYRAPTDAEVLAHPAALAEVDRLKAELADARRYCADAERMRHGFYQAIRARLEPPFAPEDRSLEWDVLPSTIGGIARERDRWIAVRDEARRLDEAHRPNLTGQPGAVMDDDDIVEIVIRVLRRAADKGGSNG